MIMDLLDAAQIRAGHTLNLRLRECNLDAIAKQVVEEVSTEQGNRIKCECDEPVRGFWDEPNLRRAIENLVSNAVKHGWQHTHILVRVRPDGNHALLTVENKGETLSEEDQQLVFKPYYRAKPARTNIKKGWGLGLTLVKGIAEAHGGEVHISSRNENTIFSIRLPFDSRQFAQTAQEKEVGTPELDRGVRKQDARGTPI
jgi:signal transduction histidine kinase